MARHLSPKKATSPPRKRMRVEEATHSASVSSTSEPRNVDPGEATGSPLVPQGLDGAPAALRIIRALQRAERLKCIGYCPTKYTAQMEKMEDYDPDPDRDEDTGGGRQGHPQVKPSEERFGRLVEIAKANGKDLASGILEEPFTLRITRQGCEFDGTVLPDSTNFRLLSLLSNEKKAAQEVLHARLQQWYGNAQVSGYGDVHAQVTKVDENVRAAREINTSEFAVEDVLLRRIERIWKRNFMSASKVRAQPYKIHLYGPGGHFKPHRDTPQKDLVGTFLVSLGDTALHGGLMVDGHAMEASPGSWCAFYPDVPHRVTRLDGGYRAAISFKLFRTPGADTGDSKKTAKVRRKVGKIVAEMEAPYGVLLAHKYSLGTDRFIGFDALFVDAVRSQSAGRFDVRSLPVVMTTWSVWGSDSRSDVRENFSMHCSTRVYPFTNAHIDILNDPGYKRKPEGDECAWLEGVKDVPFYTVDLSKRTMFPFQDEHEETCNYVGNEAQAWREDSVYLTYALVVLPKATN